MGASETVAIDRRIGCEGKEKAEAESLAQANAAIMGRAAVTDGRDASRRIVEVRRAAIVL